MCKYRAGRRSFFFLDKITSMGNVQGIPEESLETGIFSIEIKKLNGSFGGIFNNSLQASLEEFLENTGLPW